MSTKHWIYYALNDLITSNETHGNIGDSFYLFNHQMHAYFFVFLFSYQIALKFYNTRETQT